MPESYSLRSLERIWFEVGECDGLRPAEKAIPVGYAPWRIAYSAHNNGSLSSPTEVVLATEDSRIAYI
jgi:hypothetical protein